MTSTRSYVQQVFDRMVAEAVDGLWSGNLTTVVADVTSLSYYSRIIAMLKRSGAAEQVQRGGGHSPSVWKILEPATDFASVGLSGTATALGDGRGISKLERRVKALESLIGGIDVPQALVSISEDISLLKRYSKGGGGEKP